MLCTPNFEGLVSKKQKSLIQRMVRVGRAFWRPSSPTPWQDRVTWSIQVGPECLHRGRLHAFPGQPNPVLFHPQHEEVLPHCEVKTSCVLVCGHRSSSRQCLLKGSADIDTTRESSRHSERPELPNTGVTRIACAGTTARAGTHRPRGHSEAEARPARPPSQGHFNTLLAAERGPGEHAPRTKWLLSVHRVPGRKGRRG